MGKDRVVFFLRLVGGQAGEYYYELFGTSSPPLPLETYKMQVKAEASGTKEPLALHRGRTEVGQILL